MHLFAGAKPKRIVVKTYGRDSLLGLLSPLLSAVLVSLGREGLRLKSEAQVAREMQKDAEVMAGNGYRIVSSEHFEIARFGMAYEKVTFEMVVLGK